ncbi:MAG: ABC transporter permease [Bdellovibrionota bacterium]
MNSSRPRTRCLSNQWRKWSQTAAISMTNALVYKLNFLLLTIGPVLVFFLIQFNLWSSLYELQGVEEIRGYSQKDMIAYQGWVLIVTLLTQTYNSRNLAEDIRLGRISAYLIYPFEFWQYHLATFFGQQIIQTIIAILSLVSLITLGIIPVPHLISLLIGLLTAILAGLLWYHLQYAIGLLAFWLEETWTLRVIISIMASFLSGAVIPLELFPPWARDLALLSPFPYLTFIPVKSFLGTTPALPLPAPCILLLWIGVTWLIGRIIWRRGIHLYSAAGM